MDEKHAELDSVKKKIIRVYLFKKYSYREIEQILGLSSFVLDNNTLHNRLNRYIYDKGLQDGEDRTQIMIDDKLLKLLPERFGKEKISYEAFHQVVKKSLK